MPQVFQVLKCYKCLVFQVHQTKKTNKWECKMCGETQSIKRHYGLGTGKECRLHVQKLNGIRSELDELNDTIDPDQVSEEYKVCKITNEHNITDKKYSKWSNFTDKTEKVSESNEFDKMFLGDAEVVLEVPNKKRKFSNPKKVMNLTNEPIVNHTAFITKLQDDENSTPRRTVFNANISESCVARSTFTLGVSKENSHNAISPEYYKPATSDKNHQSEMYVPPKVSVHSKWAEYAEDDEEIKDKSYDEKGSQENINNNNLFSLCDENDLDDVLAF